MALPLFDRFIYHCSIVLCNTDICINTLWSGEKLPTIASVADAWQRQIDEKIRAEARLPAKANPMTAAERMRAYRQRKKAAGFKNVRHWEPEAHPFEGRYSDHQILDARSLALHCAIARKIAGDPTMLLIAKDNLERWSKKAGRHPPKYPQEWQTILKRPWPEIAHFICSMSDDAIRLRSSSPFAGILSDAERERVYAAFRA